MNFNTLVDPIVSGYLYTNVYNSQKGGKIEDDIDEIDDMEETIRGGFPVSKLYTITKKTKPPSMRGGSYADINEPALNNQMHDYVVPIGLVYISSVSQCNNGKEFKNMSSVPQLVDTVDTSLYDNLLKTASYSISKPTTAETKKKGKSQNTSKTSKRKTHKKHK